MAGDNPSTSGTPLADASAEIAAWALSEEFDVPLEQARLQMEQQPAVFDFSAEFQRSAGDSWAGSWIDQANGGELVVQVTDAAVLEAGELANAPVPARVDAVQNSLAVLNEDVQEVQADLLRISSPAISYVDLKLNRVVIRYPSDAALRSHGRSDGLPGETRASVEAIARGYDTVESHEVPYLFETEVGCSSFYGACDPPLRGGMEITPGDGLGPCTSGFNVRSKSDRKPYMLTAAHCVTELGVPWTDVWSAYVKNGNDVGVGPTHNLVPPNFGSDDQAIMRFLSPSFWGMPEPTRVLVQSSGGTRPTVKDDVYAITSVGLAASIPADGYLCKTGATTDTGCHLFVGTLGWFGVLEVRAADAENSCPGDSGGPYFAAHKGYGIHHGAEHTAFRTYTTLTTGTQPFDCAVDLGPNPLIFYMSLSRAMSQLNVELSP